MNKEDVLALATLSRIKITDLEAANLSSEFDAILGYVGEVKNIKNTTDDTLNQSSLRSVMRKDEEPHESGIYTEKILSGVPYREGDYVKVKKIL